MKFILIQILGLLILRRLTLDNCLASRVSINKSFVYGIKNRTLKLVMEVHSRLLLV